MLRVPLALFLVTFSVALVASAMAAENPIQLENAKAGDPHWVLTDAADAQEIEGFASATSVNRGESIAIYVNTVDPSYQIEIFRLGWYGGDGARKVAGPVMRTGVRQPIPLPDPQSGLVECNWSDPYVLTIPAASDPTDWCSGVYLARLTGSSGKQSYVMFVVRDDGRSSNHYFQSSVTTFEAYNNWGGKSLYEGNPQAAKVSFNRPYAAGAGTADFLWRWEYNMLRFLEREGYDVTYCTDIDTARRGSLLLNHRSFLSVGHDEYWSAEMRDNVQAARDQGVSLAFFSGNDSYWQIRLEPDTATGTPDRTIVAYKEFAMRQDPYALDADASNDPLITTTWRSTVVNRPEAALLGVQYLYNPVRPPGDIVIDDTTTAPWVFENTGLVTGSKLVGLLGYEVDAIASASPANVVRLGHSPFQNNDSSPSVTEYSDMSLYTAPGGAKVFAAGSIQWAWGLDDWNSAATHVAPIPAAQQMTRNLLRAFAATNASYDCQYTMDPSSASLDAAGGSGQLSVTTAIGCSWSPLSNAPWLSVTSPTATVSGSGTIAYSWATNSGPQRTAAIDVAGRTFAITQATGCTVTLSPGSASEPAAGGSGSFSVSTSSPDCTWSAVPSASWISIAGASSGSGAGTVSFTVAATSGSSRSGTIAVGGQSFTVTQASGCSYDVSPMTISSPTAGSTGSITVTTDDTCHWQAATAKDWITITDAGSGRGNGTVTYQIAANDGAARNGSMAVAGKSVTVSQDGVPCSYSISPSAVSVASGASTAIITVTAPPRCGWAASSSTSWLSVSPSSGSGSGSVTVTIAANPGSATRQGSAAIAAQKLTVTQSGVAQMQLTATGSSSSSVALGWTAISGAASYQVGRSPDNGPFQIVGSTSGTSFSDAGLPANTAYRYQVLALDGPGNTIASSNVEIGASVVFTDDPLVAGETVIKAVHLLELRSAIDALRRTAGLGSFSWSGAAAGLPVTAGQVQEMRSATDQAYRALGLPDLAWTSGVALGGTIRAVHFQEIRSAVH